MALKISISAFISGGYTNPVRWDLIETGTGVKIDDHTEAGPHGQVYAFSFVNNIRDIVYTIKLYDVPGGAGIGNLIKSHDVTVSTSTITFDSDLEIIVGGADPKDPVDQDTATPAIPELIGKEYYVQQRGIGQLLQTRNIEMVPDTVNGGFALTGGNTFNEGDIFIVKIKPTYIGNPAGSQSPTSVYKDVVLITNDIVLSSSDFGKLFLVDGVLPVVTIQLPAVIGIVEKVPLWIESIGTNHVNVIIKAAALENITATAAASNTFILGRAEKGQVINLGGTLYGFTDSEDIKKAGQLDWGYYLGKNRLWANGSEYVIADYPRLKKGVDGMPAGSVVSYAVWAQSQVINGITIYPNKGKFAISNDGLSIKLPDWRNMSMRALRYSDNTADTERISQGSGGLQNQAVQKHQHFTINNHSDSTGNGLTALNYLTFQGEKAGIGDFKYTLFASNDLPTLGLTSEGQGPETRGINYGLIPMIII